MAELALDKYLMDELSELESEIGNVLYEGAPLSEALAAAVHFFSKYERLLNTIYDFRGLSYALEQLVLLLERIDPAALPDGNREDLVVLLTSLVQDLTDWRTHVLVRQSAPDVHYLDDSLLTSIHQIERLTGEEVDVPDDTDVELF